MDDEKRYREQAKSARGQASLLRDPAAAEQWLKIAAEYDRLADVAAERPQR